MLKNPDLFLFGDWKWVENQLSEWLDLQFFCWIPFTARLTTQEKKGIAQISCKWVFSLASHSIWAAKQKNTHTQSFFGSALSCGHWGWEWALWDKHEFSKTTTSFSWTPRIYPPHWSLAILFFLHIIALPSGQGETSSILLTSRAWWVEPPPPGGVGYPTGFCFVLFCWKMQSWKFGYPTKTTKDIDLMGIPCLGGEKEPSSSRNEGGEQPSSAQGSSIFFFQ